MPRSGHHLLEKLLEAALGERFGYCEFYQEPGCCRQFPCAKPSAALFMQKSHDFGLTDPLWPAPIMKRIVQYRSPIPRALSNYELHLRSGAHDSAETFRKFLVYEALYTCRFYKKWIAPREPSFFYLTYEEMVADPMKTALSLLRFLGVTPDRPPMAIESVATAKARVGVPFVRPDEISSHRYVNLPMLANFEALVIRYCPGWFPMRFFTATIEDAEYSIIGREFKTALFASPT